MNPKIQYACKVYSFDGSYHHQKLHQDENQDLSLFEGESISGPYLINPKCNFDPQTHKFYVF